MTIQRSEKIFGITFKRTSLAKGDVVFFKSISSSDSSELNFFWYVNNFLKVINDSSILLKKSEKQSTKNGLTLESEEELVGKQINEAKVGFAHDWFGFWKTIFEYTPGGTKTSNKTAPLSTSNEPPI